MNLILELQSDALNNSIKVTNLLRKAYVAARKLSLNEFLTWIEKELNGYDKGSEIPAYRYSIGEIRAYNDVRGEWQPFIIKDPTLAEKLSRRPCGQSIAEIDSLLESKDSIYRMPFPSKVTNELMEASGAPFPPMLLVSRSSLVFILDAVRNTILNWTIKLEEMGIHGENLSFTKEEQKIAKHVPQTVNYFYSVGNVQLQQHSPGSVQISDSQLNIGSIRKVITKIKDSYKELPLGPEEYKAVDSNIQNLESQFNSPKPKRRIIKKSLSSIKRILEGAGGALAAQLAIELGKFLV